MEILAAKWNKNRPPRRVLAIRLQAMGDLVITLPYLQGLRNMLPANTTLDLLTRKEVEAIPRNMNLFNRIYALGGGRNTKKQLICTAALIPRLLLNRYEVVIDLQDNIISRIVTHWLRPKAWSLFDRLSERAAGERTRLTIEAIGLGACPAASGFTMIKMLDSAKLLRENGWIKDCQLIILNPAGAFETRNWALDNYIRFAALWLKRFPKSQFLILGTGFIADKAAYLEQALGDLCINLVNKTTPAQAFIIMQQVKFVLSEDSGLMHMAWVSGIPTLALFGSTRSEKARPLGEHTAFVDSADLECGGCMLEKCRYENTPCLSRYSPEMIFKKALSLMNAGQASDAFVMEQGH